MAKVNTPQHVTLPDTIAEALNVLYDQYETARAEARHYRDLFQYLATRCSQAMDMTPKDVMELAREEWEHLDRARFIR